MKYLLFLSLLFLSCSSSQQENLDNDTAPSIRIEKAFQNILYSAHVSGVILIFDTQKNQYYTNDLDAVHRSHLPASTFKIPHSIIGLETGVLQNKETIFPWNGEERAFSIWEKDLSLQEAFQASCVPCYQELARKIGTKRMVASLQKLDFGQMDVHEDNLHLFWLVGHSAITPFQQIGFLRRLYDKQLPISTPTHQALLSMMKIQETEHSTLSGKTGLAVDGDIETGWFVGYFETKENNYFFATLISPTHQSMTRRAFIPLRKKVTLSALQEMAFKAEQNIHN